MSVLRAIFPRRRIVELAVVGLLTFVILRYLSDSSVWVGALGSLYASVITGIVDHVAQSSAQNASAATLGSSERAVSEVVRALESAQRYANTAFQTGRGLSQRDTAGISRAMLDARLALERVRVNLSHLSGRGGAP